MKSGRQDPQGIAAYLNLFLVERDVTNDEINKNPIFNGVERQFQMLSL